MYDSQIKCPVSFYIHNESRAGNNMFYLKFTSIISNHFKTSCRLNPVQSTVPSNPTIWIAISASKAKTEFMLFLYLILFLRGAVNGDFN